jgi:hypothetical protein
VEEGAACIDGFGRTGLMVRHAFMNKFRGPEDTNFKLVSKPLRDLVNGAQEVLNHRANREYSKLLLYFAINHGTTPARAPR